MWFLSVFVFYIHAAEETSTISIRRSNSITYTFLYEDYEKEKAGMVRAHQKKGMKQK